MYLEVCCNVRFLDPAPVLSMVAIKHLCNNNVRFKNRVPIIIFFFIWNENFNMDMCIFQPLKCWYNLFNKAQSLLRYLNKTSFFLCNRLTYLPTPLVRIIFLRSSSWALSSLVEHLNCSAQLSIFAICKKVILEMKKKMSLP